MKLGDIFKKRSNPSDSGGQAREHHYRFAHQALPQMAFADPNRAMGILGGPDAVPFLNSIWQSVSEDLPAAQRLSPQGLRCATRSVDNYAVAIVVLPPAIEFTEAIFIALAYGPMGDSDEASQRSLRYFTLEVGFVLEGDAAGRTVVGEWTSQPAHLNWGDGPPSDDPDAFLEAVRALLNQQGELRGATSFAE